MHRVDYSGLQEKKLTAICQFPIKYYFWNRGSFHALFHRKDAFLTLCLKLPGAKSGFFYFLACAKSIRLGQRGAPGGSCMGTTGSHFFLLSLMRWICDFDSFGYQAWDWLGRFSQFRTLAKVKFRFLLLVLVWKQLSQQSCQFVTTRCRYTGYFLLCAPLAISRTFQSNRNIYYEKVRSISCNVCG